MALGAPRLAVLRLIVGEGMTVGLMGIGAGPKTDPGFGLASPAQLRQQRLRAPCDVANHVAVDAAVETDCLH